jgi:hypothetical protein
MIVEAAALVIALSLAGTAALLSTARAVRQRRRLQKFCASCGRLRVLREPTCDCD